MTKEQILKIVEMYREEFERRGIQKKRMDTSLTLGSLTSNERLMHAHFLLDGIAIYVEDPEKEGKVNRHLASVQMILSFESWYTLNELMEHNRSNKS